MAQIDQKGMYYSDNKRDWFPCTVTAINPDGGLSVNLTGVDPAYSAKLIPMEKLTTHFKAAKAHDPRRVNVGSAAECAHGLKGLYYSVNKGAYYTCTVINHDLEGGVCIELLNGARTTIPKSKLAARNVLTLDVIDDLPTADTITNEPPISSPRGEAPARGPYPTGPYVPTRVGEKVLVFAPRHQAYVMTTVDKVNDDGTVEVSLQGEAVQKIKPDGINITPVLILDCKVVAKKAIPYYNVLQKALHPGGEATMSTIMAHHLTKFGHIIPDEVGGTPGCQRGLDKERFTVLFKHLCCSLGLDPPQDSSPTAAETAVDHTKPDFPDGLIEDCFREYVGRAGYGDSNMLRMAPGKEGWYTRMIRMLVSSFKLLGGADIKPNIAKNGSFNMKYRTKTKEEGGWSGGGVEGVCCLVAERGSNLDFVMKAPNDQNSVEDWEKVCDKSHPNIVRVFEFFTNPVHIVLEVAQGGDLFGVAKKFREKYPGTEKTPKGDAIGWACPKDAERWIAKVMYQAMAGVKYLHVQCNQVHNDLKPENVLLACACPTFATDPRVMIADFGCAVQASVVTLEGGEVTHNNGDPRYQPPERFPDFKRAGNYATDVWSLGVILFELTSGGLLIHTDEINIKGWTAFMGSWKEPSDVAKKWQRCMHPRASQPNWDQVTVGGEPCKQLCKRMLALSEIERHAEVPQQTMTECMAYPWFNVAFRDAEKRVPVRVPTAIKDLLLKRTKLCSLEVAMLNLVVAKLQDETSMEVCRGIWTRFDEDSSGTLDEEEFLIMLQSGCGMDSVSGRELCKIADMDSSGEVDYSEFVALMFDGTKLSDAKLHQHLYSLFCDIAAPKVVEDAVGDPDKVYLEEIDLSNAFCGRGFGLQAYLIVEDVEFPAISLVPDFFKAMCAPESSDKTRVSFKEFKDFICRL